MTTSKDDPRLLAYALGELDSAERAEVEALVTKDPELQKLVAEYRELAGTLTDEFAQEPQPKLTPEQRRAVLPPLAAPRLLPRTRRLKLLLAAGLPLAAAAAVVIFVGVYVFRPSPLQQAQTASVVTAVPGAGPKVAKKAVSGTAPSSNGPVVYCATPKLDDSKLMKSIEEDSPMCYAAKPAKQPGVMGISGVYGGRRDNNARVNSPSVLHLAADAPDAFGPNTGAEIGSHERIVESRFMSARAEPLSTFSIDVDTASYSMVRRQLVEGRFPHPDSVRIEELVNYFSYDYPQPTGEHPFSVNIEVASCPWNLQHRLVKIGLKGREIAVDRRPMSNLVFLLDVSGSMESADKLPLVKQAMARLTQQLGENDRVAIVVYAGATGLALPSTTGDQKQKILDALEALHSGGSTAGAAGLELAYKVATENQIKGGVNRVILCTDGDFNVGISGKDDLERLIVEKAKSGVFLSVLGFGEGNVQDGKMETLADKGNGNYAYIDGLKEAEKVLVQQLSGTLVTIAKDVKIQVNFNRHQVNAYRLLGYENRMLRKEDFHDDKKDAGEIGAGHTVTALYEVVPVGVEDVLLPAVDEDKYTAPPSDGTGVAATAELLTVKLRYKQPDADASTLLEEPVVDQGLKYSQSSPDYKFAAAVAAFGMLLRGSEFRGSATYDTVIELAGEGVGRDPNGYRQEFIELAKKAKSLAPQK